MRYSPSGPSYGTASDPGLGYVSPAVSTYTGGATGSAYQGGGDPTVSPNMAAAMQAAKNMALARTLGPDTGLLAGQAEIQRQQAAAASAMNNAAVQQAHTGAMTMQQAQNAYDDEVARQALTSHSMGPNYGALSGSARLAAGGVSDINAQINAAQKANEIAAAKARWGSMDDATQRTMMASAGKPNMGAMLEAMARQQALANISAAGGMEMGGLLGEIETNVDVGGTRGSATGGFGRE